MTQSIETLTDPAQIAKSLSEAQKQAMLEWTSSGIAPWVSGAVIGALRKLGLIDKKNTFTPLGLAVRAILEETL